MRSLNGLKKLGFLTLILIFTTSLFAQNPLGYLYVDKDGRVIDCNSKLASIVGSEREKILKLNIFNDVKDRAGLNSHLKG